MLRSLARQFMFIAHDLVAKHGRFYSTVGGNRRLEGKVALITGGANGLGKATAHEYVQHGAEVVIADIDSMIGRKVTKDLGHAAHFVECDVIVESEVADAVDIAMARHGKLDIMLNNAGITGRIYPSSIADLKLENFDRVMQINIRGIAVGIKHAARVMIPTGSGSIICTPSISGLMGGPPFIHNIKVYHSRNCQVRNGIRTIAFRLHQFQHQCLWHKYPKFTLVLQKSR